MIFTSSKRGRTSKGKTRSRVGVLYSKDILDDLDEVSYCLISRERCREYFDILFEMSGQLLTEL